jgi:glyoxylase-like metal-dependent hydrolase (beta-lactamase superfamily II)
VPKSLWGRRAPADEQNRIAVATNSYVIRTGERTILIETGVGDKLDDRSRMRMALPPVHEPLTGILAAHGIDPESIDTVVNSHLHFDHCGGNTVLTDAGPLPAFRRARYFATREEWAWAHRRHPRDGVSYIDANYDPLVDSGRMALTAPDHEVAPGIWMRRVPGHNPNLCVVTATSGGQTFCFWSDLVPTVNHTQPTWVAAFDLDPLEVIDQKSRWLARAADEQWICGFGHDPVVGFARIERDEKRQFRAVAIS